MGISMGGVAAWSVPDQLPAGPYIAKPMNVERTQSSNGNEQVQVDWRVAAGDYTGAERRDWITVTEASAGRVAQLIDACGQERPQQEFNSYAELADWVAEMLRKGPATEIVIRLKADRKGAIDEGTGEVKMWPEVAGYRLPNPSDVPNDASGFKAGVAVDSSVCKVDGCNEPAVEKGSCKKHAVPF